MTWERALSIALAAALANLLRAYFARYKAWKAARTDIPAARNWRGVYVPDLKLKRIERAVIWGWVLFVVAGFAFSYYSLTDRASPLVGQSVDVGERSDTR